MKNKFIGNTNMSCLDQFSAQHFISGFVIGIIFVFLKSRFNFLSNPKYFFGLGLILMLLWEVFEAILRHLKYTTSSSLIKPLSSPESWLNIFSDVIIGMIGLVVVYFFIKIIK